VHDDRAGVAGRSPLVVDVVDELQDARDVGVRRDALVLPLLELVVVEPPHLRRRFARLARPLCRRAAN